MNENSILENVTNFETTLGSEMTSSEFGFQSALNFDEQDAFPISHIEVVKKSGFFDFFIPVEHGGSLTRVDELLLLARALSRRDLTSAIAIGQTLLGALPVWLAGSPQQQQKLKQFISNGELGCLALTEKENGSDILSTNLIATETDNHYILSGEKWLINNATRGSFLTLLVRLKKSSGQAKLACLFLDKTTLDNNTYHNLPKIKTHGIRGADISGISFNQCKVAKSALIPSSGPDIYTILKTLQISRILCSGFSLGAFDSALRTTYRFCQERTLYGKSILEIPVVKKKVVSSFSQLLLSDVVAQMCSRAINYTPEYLSFWSAICKYYIPATTETMIQELKTVLGARFYLREEHCFGIFQKIARDNEVVALFDGSSQVNLSIISGQMVSIAKDLTNYDSAQELDIKRLFLISNNIDVSDVFHIDKLKLSNNGKEPILLTFLNLTSSSTEKNILNWANLNELTLNKVNRLKHKLMSWIDAVLSLQGDSSIEINSSLRFELAQQLTILFSAVSFILFCYYNEEDFEREHGNSLLTELILNTVLNTSLAQLGEAIEHTSSEVDNSLALLEELSNKKQLYSFQSVKLPD